MDKHTHRVERGTNGLVQSVKGDVPKQQIQLQRIKGIALGSISLKTPIKDVLDLITITRGYSTLWINKNDERISEFDILRMDTTQYPISAWMFPDSESIKNGDFQDLPF